MARSDENEHFSSRLRAWRNVSLDAIVFVGGWNDVHDGWGTEATLKLAVHFAARRAETILANREGDVTLMMWEMNEVVWSSVASNIMDMSTFRYHRLADTAVGE